MIKISEIQIWRKGLLVVVSLLTFWAISAPTVSAIGFQNGNATKANQDVLTNGSITRLVKAGLGETVIINMVSAQPGKYSLTAEDVIALKRAGVSDTIISAMIKKSTGAYSTLAPATGGVTPGAVTEVGVYLKKRDAWVQMMPEVVNWRTGGVIKSHVTVGIIKGDVNGRVNGETSRYSVGSPVDFLIYVPEGVEITEYQLVRLHKHHDAREFRTVTGGVFHQSGGAKRDTLSFDFKKTGTRMYLVSLSGLESGEYGFLSPGSVLSSHASAQLGKMYTFHVIDEVTTDSVWLSQ